VNEHRETGKGGSISLPKVNTKYKTKLCNSITLKNAERSTCLTVIGSKQPMIHLERNWAFPEVRANGFSFHWMVHPGSWPLQATEGVPRKSLKVFLATGVAYSGVGLPGVNWCIQNPFDPRVWGK
jgi:hypothetical protein